MALKKKLKILLQIWKIFKNTMEYKESITIVRNIADTIILFVQARSLQEKVTQWTKDYKTQKWTPKEIKWEGWFEQMSRPVTAFKNNNPYLRCICHMDLPRFFLFCDMYGIEVRCRMLRKGKFTDDEWKLINEHCKMVKWTKN